MMTLKQFAYAFSKTVLSEVISLEATINEFQPYNIAFRFSVT